LQEALDLTPEEMDIQAHELLQQEHHQQYAVLNRKPLPHQNKKDKL
jgi:hypothetical protein